MTNVVKSVNFKTCLEYKNVSLIGTKSVSAVLEVEQHSIALVVASL